MELHGKSHSYHARLQLMYLHLVFKVQQVLLMLPKQLQVGHWTEACILYTI